MQHHVIISFGKDREFHFHFTPADLAGSSVDEARQWFDREFTTLECDVATPTGKVLIIDRILSVAKYAGEQRFKEQASWADQFAKYSALILARDLIRVDVANYAIGY
jgi:hypothetical protein